MHVQELLPTLSIINYPLSIYYSRVILIALSSSRGTTFQAILDRIGLVAQQQAVAGDVAVVGHAEARQLGGEVAPVAPVAELGPRIETHPRFPRHVNAGFLQVVSRREIRLRVHERGAGETLACGTGACAAVVAGITRVGGELFADIFGWAVSLIAFGFLADMLNRAMSGDDNDNGIKDYDEINDYTAEHSLIIPNPLRSRPKAL